MRIPKLEDTILNLKIEDGSSFILDSTIIINALAHKDVANFLESLQGKCGCELYTIPEVIYEVAHGAINSKEKYLNARNFYKLIGIAYLNFDHRLDNLPKQEVQKFSYYYSYFAKQASYTDYKLCLTAFCFPGVKIISGNTRDIPQTIFKPIGAIVTNLGASIRTDVIYQFDKERYDRLPW